MTIIIKFILRNIKENKFRTFLILLSVMLSSALFFASVAMSGTLEQLYIEQVKKYYGTSEIMIYANSNSPSSMLALHQAEAFADEMEYIVGVVMGQATYIDDDSRDIHVDLRGYRMEDIEAMNPIYLEEKLDIAPFNNRKIIIGRSDATKYNLSTGSTIALDINGSKHSFIISGIASSQGLFRPESNSFTVLLPRETLSSIYGTRGLVSALYIKTKNPVTIDENIEFLSREFSHYTVTETISQRQLKEMTQSITTPFLLMLVLVVFISIFIIYTAFKVITAERLPIVGTFRSIGATKKATNTILMGESIAYGLIGGGLGCFVGIGILSIITKIMAHNPYSDIPLHAELLYGLHQIIMTIAGAIVLSIISSIIPIVRTSKIPIKDIVLDNIETQKKKKTIKLYTGLLLSFIGFTVPWTIKGIVPMPVMVTCLIMLIIGIVLLVPYITFLFITILGWIYGIIFGNEGILAVKNLKDNKSISDNIALLTVGIASLIMIISVTHSTGIEVLNEYNKADYDISMEHHNADRSFEQRIRAVDGVSDTLAAYTCRNIIISYNDKNAEIWTLYGTNMEKYFDHHDFELTDDMNTILNEAPNDRNIILTNSMMERLGVEPGDIISMETEMGTKSYNVISGMQSLWNNGNIAVIPERYFKWDIPNNYYTSYYLRTYKDPDLVNGQLDKKFSREGVWSETMDTLHRMNNESNNQMFIILGGFSVVTMLIGIVGIFNNFVVSMLSRRRSMAILRSVGMSKAQALKMLLVESLSGGLIGGASGLFCGYLLNQLAGFIMKALGIPVKIHYIPSLFIVFLLCGITVSIVASLSPSFKMSKINIVQAIKYE